MAAQVPVSIPRMDLPVVDPKTGMVNQEWYSFFEAMRDRTGGDDDLVGEAGSTAAQAQETAQKADEAVAKIEKEVIKAGRGLEGGGPVGEGVELRAKTSKGWVPSTGTADKTTPYVSHTPIVGEPVYDPAQITALSSDLAALSRRYVALESGLRTTEALTP